MNQSSKYIWENLEQEFSKNGGDSHSILISAYGTICELAYQAVVLDADSAKQRIIELSQEVKISHD